MKLVSAIILVVCLFMSCKTAQIGIGMSEKDFKVKFRSEVVEKTFTNAVYRRSWQPIGGSYQVKFYYFDKGTLVRIDEGVRRPDVIIQHTN